MATGEMRVSFSTSESMLATQQYIRLIEIETCFTHQCSVSLPSNKPITHLFFLYNEPSYDGLESRMELDKKEILDRVNVNGIEVSLSY